MPYILTILAALLTLTAISLTQTARLEAPILNVQALLPLLAIVWALTLLAFAPAKWQHWLAAPF